MKLAPGKVKNNSASGFTKFKNKVFFICYFLNMDILFVKYDFYLVILPFSLCQRVGIPLVSKYYVISNPEKKSHVSMVTDSLGRATATVSVKHVKGMSNIHSVCFLIQIHRQANECFLFFYSKTSNLNSAAIQCNYQELIQQMFQFIHIYFHFTILK